MALATVNTVTLPTDNKPAGKCRPAVRGFWASIRRSTNRLKAIAVLRAVTMHNKTPSQGRQPIGALFGSWTVRLQAITPANRANGSANSVWLKRIISRINRNGLSIVTDPERELAKNITAQTAVEADDLTPTYSVATPSVSG